MFHGVRPDTPALALLHDQDFDAGPCSGGLLLPMFSLSRLNVLRRKAVVQSNSWHLILRISAGYPQTMLVITSASDTRGAPWTCGDVRQVVLGNLRCGRLAWIPEASWLLGLLFSIVFGFLVRRTFRSTSCVLIRVFDCIVRGCWVLLLCIDRIQWCVGHAYRYDLASFAVILVLLARVLGDIMWRGT